MYREHELRAALLEAVTVLSAGCGVPPPDIRGLEVDPRPSERVPLAAQVTFETSRPATVALQFDDGA